MKYIIVSGRSGAGKTVALRALEDLGFYCADNIPPRLLSDFTQQVKEQCQNIAVGIDARNAALDLKSFKDIVAELKLNGIDYEVLFLDAEEKVILKRFSETRRKHPLTDQKHSLIDAIRHERKLLEPIARLADLRLDTSMHTAQQFRTVLQQHISPSQQTSLSLLVQSFGYKIGLPVDADIVFDVRCLPNPYWEPALAEQTGLDADVIAFFAQHQIVADMQQDILQYLQKWLPCFAKENRAYMTVAIGCTGGQHRSVFLASQVSQYLEKTYSDIKVRHRELP